MGKLRAAAIAELLAELNEGVASSYVAEAPRSLMESNPAFFSDFQLVLATQVCLLIRQRCWMSLIDRSSRLDGFGVLISMLYADEGARPDAA